MSGRDKIDHHRKLSFFPPTKIGIRVVAEIAETNLLQAEAQWSNTLVGYVLGKRSYFHHVQVFVNRVWNPKGKLDVLTIDNGFFMFKFSLYEVMNRILKGGPYFFDGRPLVLKLWKRNVGLDRDILNTLPVWIRFPILRISFWTPLIISKLASTVG